MPVNCCVCSGQHCAWRLQHTSGCDFWMLLQMGPKPPMTRAVCCVCGAHGSMSMPKPAARPGVPAFSHASVSGRGGTL